MEKRSGIKTRWEGGEQGHGGGEVAARAKRGNPCGDDIVLPFRVLTSLVAM